MEKKKKTGAEEPKEMKAPSQKISYTEALKEIEAIYAAIEQNAVPIDQLAEKVKRAMELVEFCKGKLREVETQLNRLTEE